MKLIISVTTYGEVIHKTTISVTSCREKTHENVISVTTYGEVIHETTISVPIDGEVIHKTTIFVTSYTKAMHEAHYLYEILQILSTYNTLLRHHIKKKYATQEIKLYQ